MSRPVRAAYQRKNGGENMSALMNIIVVLLGTPPTTISDRVRRDSLLTEIRVRKRVPSTWPMMTYNGPTITLDFSIHELSDQLDEVHDAS